MCIIIIIIIISIIIIIIIIIIMCIYIYIYIYIHTHTRNVCYTCIYIYIEREREIERESSRAWTKRFAADIRHDANQFWTADRGEAFRVGAEGVRDNLVCGKTTSGRFPRNPPPLQ